MKNDLAELLVRHPLPWTVGDDVRGNQILDARGEIVTVIQCVSRDGACVLAKLFVSLMPASADTPRPRADA